MLSIEGFGATVVIGACFIAGLVLTLDWLLSTTFFDRIKSNANKKAPLGLLVLLLALSYAAGILIENTSDYVVGLESDHPWLRWKLLCGVRSEAQLKQDVLVHQNWDRTSLGKDIDEAGLFSKYAGERLEKSLDMLRTSDPKDSKEYEEKQKNLNKRVLKVYYNAKNRVLQEDNYFTELMDIQHRIDFIRSFALGSGYLLIGILAIVFLSFTPPDIAWLARGWLGLPRQRNPNAKSVSRGVIALRALVLCAIGACFYFVAISAYQYEEKQFNKRVFGYFLSLESMQTKPGKQTDKQRSSYRISELATPRPIEASGVAAFDNHLFIVNDKDNSLYVVNPEALACPTTAVEIPGFPGEKAKFEDICFHSDSGYFYVIGAHYAGVPAYQKLFRFKVQRDGKTWKPMDVQELSISDDIMPRLPDMASVEGIAVAGKVHCPRIFVGIRDNEVGRFLILQFSGGEQGLSLESHYELQFSPEYCSAGVPYHLSGLMVLSDSKLLILAASEDENNGFHGNRVYTFDVEERTQIAYTREFALAQKAEGITSYKAEESEEQIAIVFDNDYEKTKQPSRLLIAQSLGALQN